MLAIDIFGSPPLVSLEETRTVDCRRPRLVAVAGHHPARAAARRGPQPARRPGARPGLRDHLALRGHQRGEAGRRADPALREPAAAPRRRPDRRRQAVLAGGKRDAQRRRRRAVPAAAAARRRAAPAQAPGRLADGGRIGGADAAAALLATATEAAAGEGPLHVYRDGGKLVAAHVVPLAQFSALDRKHGARAVAAVRRSARDQRGPARERRRRTAAHRTAQPHRKAAARHDRRNRTGDGAPRRRRRARIAASGRRRALHLRQR